MRDAPDSRDVVVVSQSDRSAFGMAMKRAVQWAFVVLVAHRLLAYWVGRWLMGDRAFGAASESIARIPGLRGVYARQAFYRMTLEACGRDTHLGWHSVFSMREARLGERVYIGRRCGIGFAEISDKVMLADGVQVLSGGREHGRGRSSTDAHQDRPQEYRRVSIGRGAWIGTNAVIMADVGANAIIGAGAVVTRPIPESCIAVGAPARVVKRLNGA